jgi:hypothetical protein
MTKNTASGLSIPDQKLLGLSMAYCIKTPGVKAHGLKATRLETPGLKAPKLLALKLLASGYRFLGAGSWVQAPGLRMNILAFLCIIFFS